MCKLEWKVFVSTYVGMLTKEKQIYYCSELTGFNPTKNSLRTFFIKEVEWWVVRPEHPSSFLTAEN